MTDLTTAQAAKKAKVSQNRIIRAIQKGKLKARRFGWMWLIKTEDLKEWKSEQS